MKREVKRAAPNPASNCSRCMTSGTISPQQVSSDAKPLSANRVAFHCERCHHTWNTRLEDALAHGRFLQRLDGS